MPRDAQKANSAKNVKKPQIDVIVKDMGHDRIEQSLLISIGKLKPTIGMITYRNTCALDSKGKIAYELILKLLPVIFLGKCSSNSNYFGL